MPETNHAKFLSTSFVLLHAGNSFELKGLASESGITKASVLSRPPPHIESVFGQPVMIQLGPLALKGSVVRHFADSGSFLEIRFLGLQSAQRSCLRQLLDAEGVHPGWLRRYPRIPVRASDSSNLPVASLCLLRFLGRELFAPVVDFSVGGIRIEFEGEDVLAGARVGMVVSFDLLTNQGTTLEHFHGEIRNLAVSELDVDGRRLVTKSLGLGFLEMDGKLKARFHELIRDFCLELRRRGPG